MKETGVQIMTRDEALKDVSKSLADSPKTHALLQVRIFQESPKAQALYNEFASRDSRVIINVDANTAENYHRVYEKTHSGHPLHTIRVTNTEYIDFPLVRALRGRNHIRLMIVGENAYVSAFDFHDLAFKRTEVFTKVTQPEMVQMLKVVALWDYNSKKTNWKFRTKELELVIDTGKTSKGFISRYAEKEIAGRIKPNSQVWFSSSWYPDELTGVFNLCREKGAEVNMLVDQKPNFGNLREISFTITKVLSSQLFRKSVPTNSFNIFHSKNEIHAKFLLVKTDNDYWWLVGTSNHTRFGSMARTAELGLSGTEPGVGEKLIDCFTNEPKVKI